MKYTLLFFTIMILSCGDSKQDKLVTIRTDSLLIKGSRINDSIYNDTVYYYNLNNTLIRKDYFINNKLEGASIDYFPNGKPKLITHYKDGFKYGYNSYYNSSGNCHYRDFYYFDLTVGPIIFYNDDGSPKKYFFANLENENLLVIDYLDWQGINQMYSNCINFSSNTQKRDSTDEVSVLLYLVNPPKFDFKYSVFTKAKAETEFKKLFDVKNDLPFINISLPALSNKKYVIGVEIYDSLFDKKTIIYKDI